MALNVKLPDGSYAKMTDQQYSQYVATGMALQKGDTKGAVAAIDAIGSWLPFFSNLRAQQMDILSKQTVDPFDVMIKDAALAQVKRKQTSTRQQSFISGPRGLEGPMANLIFGGGSSMLGS